MDHSTRRAPVVKRGAPLQRSINPSSLSVAIAPRWIRLATIMFPRRARVTSLASCMSRCMGASRTTTTSKRSSTPMLAITNGREPITSSSCIPKFKQATLRHITQKVAGTGGDIRIVIIHPVRQAGRRSQEHDRLCGKERVVATNKDSVRPVLHHCPFRLQALQCDRLPDPLQSWPSDLSRIGKSDASLTTETWIGISMLEWIVRWLAGPT